MNTRALPTLLRRRSPVKATGLDPEVGNWLGRPNVPRRLRGIGSGLIAGLLGVGAAVALAAGDDGVPACANKRSGEISIVGKNGRCGSGNLAITISGEAFKKSKSGTLTINGIAFKRTGSLPNSITINGNSFRTGTLPNTLTINGNTFKTSGNTLTINGVPATGGPGPTGPPGLEGRIGPTGPPGIPNGPPPTEQPVPGGIDGGTTGTLVSQPVTTSGVHRVLVTGGGNLVCNPCSDRVVATLRIERTAQSPAVSEIVVTRRVQAPTGPDGSSFGVNEMIVTPNVCNPCTYSLTLSPPAGAQGAANNVVTVSATRLGLVDLGPVASP